MPRQSQGRISAIDLFCGAGGLSHGLQEAGISVTAGIDIDPSCKYPFESNIEASFLEQDIRTVTKRQLERLWEPASVRLLAGCAPCQPFSPYRLGADPSKNDNWSLLTEFARLAATCRPELVTMENVPRIVSTAVYKEFVATLQDCGYDVSVRSCHGPDYGLPQRRRRLVLIASRIGPIDVPRGHLTNEEYRTVRDTIGSLPIVASGEVDRHDPLHKSRRLTPVNLRRVRASTPGGTWEQWPSELRAPCHTRPTGATFRNVYSRMEWDKPSPTITTLAYNFGAGRFGHPDQDRAITLREAAMLQGFPRDYKFTRPADEVRFKTLGRLIGNAVPPPIARAVGEAILGRVSMKRRKG
jgi:DNA (cytosine-5)-methyltransferase 1